MSYIAKSTIASLIAIGTIAAVNPARAADLGPDTARLLTLLYQDTRKNCGDDTKPALGCSGVLIRATQPSTAYAFYSVSPGALAKGGVSISYLRKDAKFSNFVYDMTSGFIFDNSATAGVDFKPLCSYPIDGGSGLRNQNGCGDTSGTATVEKYCEQLGITTAEQWIAHYRANGSHHWKQCAFNLRPERGAATANAFYQTIRSTALLGDEPYSGKVFVDAIANENEIVLMPWKVDVPASPPVLASYYAKDSGIEGSRLNQIQWYQATGQVLPSIRVNLPKTAQEEATFTYEPARQAILPLSEQNKCERYVERASWVNRYDPGFKKNIMSLEIVPTECGRQTQSAQTNNFFNELVSSHYLKPEWVNNSDNKGDKISSMRRQLVCVMAVARSKSSWMLEPSRPYTTHEKSVAAGCNNVSS